jgi:peptidoglycan/LPS O-acetylase OafA/YrhL
MQFYIVLPLIYLVLPQTRKGFLAGLVLITVAAAAASEWLVNTQTKDNPVGFLLLMGICLPYLYMFLLGVIIQKLLPILMPMLRGMFLPWLAIYVTTVLTMHYWGGWETGVRLGTNNPPIFISIIMAMVTISAAFTWPGLSDRILRGNDISYGTYIYHMVFINLVLYLEIQDAGWQLTIVIVSTYVCGMLSWWLVEKPTLALKQKTLRNAPSPTPSLDK